MAIISKLPKGYGDKSITKMLTINGGVGETVSITGEGLEDTVILDSVGTSTYVLVAKEEATVTFTGGLSGYETTITVVNEEDEVVNVMPEGALYWYGIGASNMISPNITTSSVGSFSIQNGASWYDLAVTKYTSVSKVINTNSISLNVTNLSGTGWIGERLIYKAVDVSNYSTVHLVYDVAVASSSAFGILGVTMNIPEGYVSTSNNSYLNYAYEVNTIGSKELIVDVSTINGNVYITAGIQLKSATTSDKSTIDIKVIWLE